ncbi:MAG: Rpn family recombination-promoting nuclease/putative transposase [Candidatus Riflebacteria bacterium]|nr:Rpn family recombination-promoting nuclease/putative transposase [Candidatus Riflebacteria bacterium]
MGKFDVLCKKYMSNNEVFADAFNYLLYGGKKKIKPEDLKPLDTSSISIEIKNTKVSNAVQKNRDVFKVLSAKRTDELGLLILGVENQAKVHYAMPVRVLLYDLLQYASQIDTCKKKNRKTKKTLTDDEFLSGFTKQDKLIPVITLVVYFGSNNWDGPTNIREMFGNAKESIAKYLPDYHINLISPDLSDDELDKLSSELGVVMKFIKQSRDKKKMLENIEKHKEFRNVSNLSATLINEATGLNLKINKEQEKIDMCQAMKEIIEDIRNEERAKLKVEKEKTKAEKAKNKAAMLRIKELEKMLKNLQAQLKTA